MPRMARIKSENGVYHVMLRGISQTQLFYDDGDRAAFVAVLKRYKEVCGFELYAYSLMGNHVHLLLKESEIGLADTIKRIALSYSSLYNRKYERSGYLFQGRYKSEAIPNDPYLWTVVRYIHNNPVKIGEPVSYWTSFDEYTGDVADLVDVDFVLETLSANRTYAQKEFRSMIEKGTQPGIKVLGERDRRRVKDAEATAMIKQIGKVNSPGDVAGLTKGERNGILALLKNEGLTIRQIARLTGVNRGIVLRAEMKACDENSYVSDYTSP
jgi:REP element-mobilizing transposase RayT